MNTTAYKDLIANLIANPVTVVVRLMPAFLVRRLRAGLIGTPQIDLK